MDHLPTVDSLLAEINDMGWYLFSAYNLPLDRPLTYQWEVTLRHPDSLVAYGQGSTFAEALSLAIENTERAAPYVAPTITWREPEPKQSLADLLRDRIPTVKIERRI